MNGILIKKENNLYVKWSDLHSTMRGDMFIETPLHTNLNNLKDGDKIDFDLITIGYDEKNFAPIYCAKI